MATRQDTYQYRRGQETAAGAWATGIVLFAAVFMFVGGSFQAIQGLAAILDDGFFTAVSNYAYDIDITTWGWVHLVCGSIVAITGLTLLTGSIIARIVAMFIVVVSAMINFVYIPYQPLWSLVLLAIDGVILWALITYQEPEIT